MQTLDDYREIVGDKIISDIIRLGRNLYGLKVLHINSTYYGGGVAEMLYTLIPLLNNVGIAADWRILRGTSDFFIITKKFHNAIQGDQINLSDAKKYIYVQTNQDFSSYCKIDADCVIIHDPQPLPMIRFFQKRQPWIWRCHVDLSHPNKELWEYLKGFILHYDKVIVSDKKYIKEDLPVDHCIIPPAIDPLSSKNKDIPPSVISRKLKKNGIPTDKPIITQVSRFDKWKDTENVIEVFKLVKKKVNCRLVLCGNMASDDPEGVILYEKMIKKAKPLIEKKDIVFTTIDDNILVNALQRISAVIIQKSIREGFGLTVSEALWKKTPVVASNVGGIPLQIIDGQTGYIVDPYDLETCAERVIELLQNQVVSKGMGTKGKDLVREKFLITRHLYDDLKLLNDIFKSS